MSDCWVLVVDGATGRIRSTNRGAEHHLGVTLGRPCHQVIGAGGGTCSAGCPRMLIQGLQDGVRQHATRVRGDRRQVVCSAVGEDIVVMLTRAASQEQPDRPALTERELEVLHLVSEGFSSPDIARILGVALPTVRTHVEHVRTKLEAKTRAEAVARALMLGLIRPSEAA